MRKVSAILAIVIIIAMSSVLALSAGVSNSEQLILDKISSSVNMNGVEMVVPPEYINQIKNYFNIVDISEEDSMKIITLLDEGIKLMINTDAPNILDMSREDKKELLNIIKKIVGVLNMTLTYDKATKYITVTDPDGVVVFKSEPVLTTPKVSLNNSSNNFSKETHIVTKDGNIIKATGSNMNTGAIVYIICILVISVSYLAGYFIKLKKERA